MSGQKRLLNTGFNHTLIGCKEVLRVLLAPARALGARILPMLQGEVDEPIYFKVLMGPLVPVSWLFWIIAVVRVELYRRGWIAARETSCRVISIGNLTSGGTGKTPLVEMVASALKRSGLRVAVVSRGYRGKVRRGMALVSDGERVLLDAEEAGDEPTLLARNLPGIPVLISRERHLAARYAEIKFQADAVVLDDGYQFMRLKRHLDILLASTELGWGNGWLIPRGVLRESPAAARRADVVVLTGPGKGKRRSQVLRSLPEGKEVFEMDYHPVKVVNLYAGTEEGLDFLKGVKGFSFSGIVNPLSFERTLREAGVMVLGHMRFNDHHHYTRHDLDRVETEAFRRGADIILTTQKDGVKVGRFLPRKIPFWALRVEARIRDGEEEFLSLLRNLFREDRGFTAER